MKRLTLCGCVAALALAAAAPGASALFSLDYNGHLQGRPHTYVGFNVDRTVSGGRTVTSFTSRGLPFRCDSGSTGKTGFLSLDDALPIKEGEFDGKSHVFTPQGDPVARVHGRLGHGKARGTLRLSGKLDPSDATASCKTDFEPWVADRGPQAR